MAQSDGRTVFNICLENAGCHGVIFLFQVIQNGLVQYIKNVRLERAADQFENGETNTLEVVLACGFSNLSYFHREFKKKYGMTPKRFISLSARAADFHEGVNNYHFYDS